jgi:hypothetical protein
MKYLAIAAGVLIVAVFIGALLLKVAGAEDRCAEIGGTYLWGRDFSACAKPDGSLWRVPG